jgi:hypothetical protein
VITSVTGSIRPIAPAPGVGPARTNHSAPSAPTVIEFCGVSPLGMPAVYSVIVPAGVISPIAS